MSGPTTDARAEAILEELKPQLLKLIEGAPAYGLIGFELIFHEGELTRFITKAEVSRKPRGGGLR
jgi:hypothetical protein